MVLTSVGGTDAAKCDFLSVLFPFVFCMFDLMALLKTLSLSGKICICVIVHLNQRGTKVKQNN